MEFTMYTGFYPMVKTVGIEKTAEYAKRNGFTSVEVLCNAVVEAGEAIPDVDSARKARDVLERYGLSVACYSVGANAWNGEEAIQGLKKRVEIASALGSPYLHHTLIPMLEEAPDYQKALKAAVYVAGSVADYARNFGVTCIYEEQGYCINGLEGFGNFYQEMKKRCKNIGVCGDFGNILYANEKPEDFLTIYAKEIRHVHVKDYIQKEADITPGRYWRKTKGKSWLRHTMVGHGVINIEACMKILKETGYDGPFALEIEHPEPFEEGVRQAMEYLQRFE